MSTFPNSPLVFKGGIVLLDPETGLVYRPLSHESAREFNRCLCSPLWVAQLTLRIGETRMLQVTYPELPASVRFLDAALSTVAPFPHIPVTGLGSVPTATRPSDLARAPERTAPLTSPLRYHPNGQASRTQSITIDHVVSGPTRTSVEWTVTSVTDQISADLLLGPPVSAQLPTDVHVANPSAASGPRIRAGGSVGPPLTAIWMTERLRRDDSYECQCTTFGLWAVSLRQAGGKASVVTNFAALPRGTKTVDVQLPGAGVYRGLPVTPAGDGAGHLGPAVGAESGVWTYAVDDPPRGWATAEWPTPTPAASQLGDFVSTVDKLAQLPR